MSPNELALALFVICNGVRAVAYFPQIVRLARDGDTARAVSCLTWGLFAVANASTVTYALIVTGDLMVAASFSLNLLCCVSIVGLAAWRRTNPREARPREMSGADR